MRIFLSYANEDKAVADSITISLRNRGHQVFLDRDDLPAGESYDQQIERAVKACDAFVFLISPESTTEGRYTLTELSFARRKWKDPNGRVLPVMTKKMSIDQVPTYLKAVTILEPVGNITAETCSAIDILGRDSYAKIGAWRFALIGAATGAICSFLPIYTGSFFHYALPVASVSVPFGGTAPVAAAPDVAIILSATVIAAIYALTPFKNWRRLLLVPLVIVPIWWAAAGAWFNWGLDEGPNFASTRIQLSDSDQIADELRVAIEKANKTASIVSTVFRGAECIAGGALFALSLIVGLSFVLALEMKRIDLMWAVAFGAIGGLAFVFFAMSGFPDSTIVVFKPKGQIGTPTLISWPGLIAAFVIWQAMMLAAVGSWVGRHAD